MRKILFVLSAIMASAAQAEIYSCYPTIECANFPGACTELDLQGDPVLISYIDQAVTVDLDEYGIVSFSTLGVHESKSGISLMLEFEGVSIFANLSNNGILSIVIPDQDGADNGNPVILQLNCEASQ